MTSLLVAIAFGIAIVAAYEDIDLFFRDKRISYTTRGNWLFYDFAVANGLISGGLLLWALVGDQSNPINLLIQVKAGWVKMLVIGFGVPALIRSKLFGEGSSAAGPSRLYDWVRGKVLLALAVLMVLFCLFIPFVLDSKTDQALAVGARLLSAAAAIATATVALLLFTRKTGSQSSESPQNCQPRAHGEPLACPSLTPTA